MLFFGNVLAQKNIYVVDNESLREVNTDLRQKLADTPLNYPTTRKGYQDNINSHSIEIP